MIDHLLLSSRSRVRHRVWVLSDLQQSVPAEARRGMTTAITDFRSLNLPIEQIWYLGDAVEGHNPAALEEMTAMQVELFKTLNAPLRYVLGNHDFDHLRYHPDHQQQRTTPIVRAAFREAVLNVPGWKTTASIDSFYFWDSIGPFTTLFLSDHADPAGGWVSTHGQIHGNASLSPYTPAHYQALRDQLAKVPGPILTCSHYAFAGGNRPSALHDHMLPLPPNIKLHFYGHAHIGDAAWAGKDLYRKIACIDNHDIIQLDIASLEDGRGSAIRSAVLEIYDDLSLGIYFRNHTTRTWEEILLLNSTRRIAK